MFGKNTRKSKFVILQIYIEKKNNSLFTIQEDFQYRKTFLNFYQKTGYS